MFFKNKAHEFDFDNMTGKNEKCPCGSGLKFKKCCMGKKTRSTTLTMKMDGKNGANTLVIDKLTSKITLLHDGIEVLPGSAFTERTIPREKDPKVVTKSKFSPNSIYLNPNAALKDYDIFFAIDTNSKIANGLPLSVTGVVWGRHNPDVNFINAVAIQYQAVHAIEFWGAEKDQERIGWMEAIEAIRRSSQFPKESRFCLIVDSYLGELESINSHKEPVIGSMFLPDNFTFLYASSDKKNDSLLNQMISLADKHSKSIMTNIIGEKYDDLYTKSTNKYYRYIRHIKNK